MRSPRIAPPVVATAFVLLMAIAACDQLTTVPAPDSELFDAPVAGLSPTELAAFARGDEEFGRQFAPNTGLGPIFNDVSCATCHSGDGRGFLKNALVRFGSEDDGFLSHLGGPQLQDKAIAGAEPEVFPVEALARSVRLPPPVFGAGMIEAIPEAAILANVDSLDADGDGISGRPNWVLAAPFVPATEPGGGPGLRLGRFGRKAQNAVLLQQVVEAYLQDMGITSPFLPLENRNPRSGIPIEAIDRVPDPEINEGVVQAVTFYLRALAPPADPGGPERAEVAQGRTLFIDIGCAKCHVPSFMTGDSPLKAISNVEVRAFSDFLLHDMGPELADNRPDGQASGSEWRTAPLWGLRLMRKFLNGQALLMHDGRARSVEDAVLLHGGEAAGVRAAFQALTPQQRAALLAYVESL